MEDNNKLLKLYKNGDKNALSKVIENNSGLVRVIARRYAYICEGKIDYEDLEQEGFIGLMKAAEYFDLELGFAFTTYAGHWIKQKITRYICNNKRGIRIPVYALQELNKFKKSVRSLAHELKKEPNIYEIARYTKLKLEKVEYLLNLDTDIASLDSPIASEDEDITLLHTIKDNDTAATEEEAIKSELRDKLLETIDTSLSEDAQKVVKLRYGFHGEAKTLEKIGELLSKSTERIRQLESQSLRRLRRAPYILKLRKEKELEERTNFYGRGVDPVSTRVINLEKLRGLQLSWSDNEFYRWYDKLLNEKYKMENYLLSKDEARLNQIDEIFTMVDNALNELLIFTRDIKACDIVRNRLKGLTEDEVKNMVYGVTYWVTENKAIDYVKKYLIKRNITVCT